MQEAAVAIDGRGQSLSYAFGELDPTFTEFDKLFRVLDTQRLAVGQLFRNGATAFSALRGREGELAEPDPELQRGLPDHRRAATATSKRSSAPSRPSRTSRG